MSAYGRSVPPSDPAVLLSPYTWAAPSNNTGLRQTINAGAYLRLLFTGNSCAANFDVSNMGDPASQIWSRIDGYGPWKQQAVAGAVFFGAGGGIDVPADTVASPWHLLELVVKSTTEGLNRWHAPSATAVILGGIVIDSDGQVASPVRRPRNILILGDSITEGVRTINHSATYDTDRNDALSGYAYRLGELLGSEIGIVGFGGTGLTKGGSGNMPPVTTYWNTLLPGITRPLTPAPDLVVINHGTNDHGASASSVIAALQSLLTGVLAATPMTTKVAVLRPFGGHQAAALQEAVQAVGSSRVHYIDTTGVLDSAYGMDDVDLHPLGTNHLAMVAPALLAPLLPMFATATVPRLRNMFQSPPEADALPAADPIAISALVSLALRRPSRQKI